MIATVGALGTAINSKKALSTLKCTTVVHILNKDSDSPFNVNMIGALSSPKDPQIMDRTLKVQNCASDVSCKLEHVVFVVVVVPEQEPQSDEIP